MTLVVDASVGLKWVLAEPDRPAAMALRSQLLIAPSFWLLEAANALRRRAESGEMTSQQCKVRLTALAEAPVRLHPSELYVAAALDLALKLHHPIYDCLYLALAIEHDCRVITADKRFFQVASRDPVCRNAITLLGA